MSATRINVGGKEFVASRSTWAKSPVLDMILLRSAEPVPFVDRSPDVFDHILDWLREGKLYIDCPSNRTYKRLCADADFYGLEDLSSFLEDRINLCSFVYYLFPDDGRMTFYSVDVFRGMRRLSKRSGTPLRNPRIPRKEFRRNHHEIGKALLGLTFESGYQPVLRPKPKS